MTEALVVAAVLMLPCLVSTIMIVRRSLRRIELALESLARQQGNSDPVASGLARRMLELQHGRFLQSHRVRDPRVTESDKR